MLSALLYACLYLVLIAVVVGVFVYLNAEAAKQSPGYAGFAGIVRLVLIALGVIAALFVLIDFVGGGGVFYYPRRP